MNRNQSFSKSDNKLTVMIPTTPKPRLEHSYESSIKKHTLSNPKFFKPRKLMSPIKMNIMKKDFDPSMDALVLKRLKQKIQKFSDKFSYKKIQGLSEKEGRKSVFDILSLTPNSREKSKKWKKTRILARRPHHMSFRNISKAEIPEKKSQVYSPKTANYEFSGDMLLKVVTHTYKPIKLELISKKMYKPACWKRNKSLL